ncbi:MAG: LPS-assembly protein LptD [Desulfuromonadales bacterium]|nr:MAG: LPS-assembly protein LptD [Desulfuromonadales bacterium]
MLRLQFLIFSLLALGLALAPASALAADADGPILVDADSITHEVAGDQVEATGNVRIRGRGMTLLSDRALFLRDKDEAEAQGNVIVTREGDTLRGDRVKLNFRDETGEVEQGNVFLKKGNLHAKGRRMYKLGPDTYRLDGGSFTTCDAENPSWKFSASDLNVLVGDYATAKHALFYIKNVPVFYFPYLVFPVKRERQSGFLTPRGGNSSKKGMTANLGYYWAISPSQDATFNLDYQSKRGTGLGVDYRYIRKRGSDGTFRGYVIYDDKQQRFRGYVVEKHQEIVSDTFNIKSDINWVSDRNFLRDYAEQTGVYNQNLADSSLSLTKHFRRQVLAGEFRYQDNLQQDVSSNRNTLQKLPTISLTGIRQRIADTPFFVSHESNFTNFYREEGIKGQRLDLSPRLTFYAKPDGPLEMSAWGGYRLRLYNSYGDQQTDGVEGDGIALAGAAISSTLARVYETGNAAMPRVRHVMVPEVRYSFVQDRNQDSLPFFDYNDRIVHENRVVYSLTNRLTGKFDRGDGTSEYRDLLSLRIAQGYEFSGTRRDLLTLVDDERKFTDIMVEATAHPIKPLTVALDSRYSTYYTRFNTAAVAADVNDGKGNSAGVTYRFARDEVDYLEGRASIALLKPVFFTYFTRYSFDRKGPLESLYTMEYRHQCWSIAFSYRDRIDTNEFFVNFSLAGIGSLGTVRVF